MHSTKTDFSEIKILIVDDESDILKFLLRYFMKRGYSTQTTNNPLQALQLIQHTHYDLVITDLKMPEMNGLQVLKKIKESSPDTEVILMTGHPAVDSAVGSIKSGAFDYLAKPFTLTEISAVVERALSHQDITQDLAHYQPLDQIKNDFLHNASHELRTPLTAIHSASHCFMEQIKSEKKLTPEIAIKFLSIIDRGSERLIETIDNLFDMYRYDSGKIKIKPISFSIERLVKECAEDFITLFQERGLELNYETEDALPPMIGDPIKIRQALINLMGNAMKFTPSGGKIKISAKLSKYCTSQNHLNADQPCIEIQVEDTGIGISDDQKEKIFEKFYQVDASSTRKNNGIGLGLSLVKTISELHHGQITVKSQPGKGSTFTLCFPLQKNNNYSTEQAPVQIHDEHQNFTKNNKIILLILCLSPWVHACAYPSKLIQNSRMDPPRMIAVIPLESQNPFLPGDTFSDFFTVEMHQSLQQIQILERKDIVKILQEQKLSFSGLIKKDNYSSFGSLLGVDAVLVGSIQTLKTLQSKGGSISIIIKLIEVSTGKILWAERQNIEQNFWTPKEITVVANTLMEKATQNLVQKMSASLSRTPWTSPNNNRTENSQAKLFYQ